jgi:FkbH-like protein
MPWLVPAPPDFRAKLQQQSETEDCRILQRLSTFDLDIGQLSKLTATIARKREALERMGCFARLRLGVVSSHTIDFIMDALPATALRHSLLLTCVGSVYGQVAQSVLDPNSPMKGKVDAVLIALDARMLGLDRAQLCENRAQAAVDNAIGTLKSLCEGIRDNLGALCVLTTIPLPTCTLFGEMESRIPGTRRSMVESFNTRILTEVRSVGDVVVDIAQIANTVGLSNWNEPRAWHAAKLPFALDCTPLYADHVCRVLAALRGKARKCLVLDLDNTLWGGIIGDDGLEGIKLGQGSAVGEAHVELQSYAMELRERGVVLAICSKNEETTARAPFKNHPEMILKEDHIAAFIANWKDKASNLREIAAMLNIGLDALVFLDDNPAEREMIRRELPEVAVPEIGAEPSEYVAAIARAGWFEGLSFSDEDKRRADYYQANAARSSAQSSITNMADYLLSLDMRISILPFDKAGRSRIAQLINKSNQFNLTTRRYNEAEIAAIETAPDKFTAQVRLVDRFGDNGMISVVIFDKSPKVWFCDTWLMSCRVLGRRVEEALLNRVAEAAIAEGATKLCGTYLPTKKNGLVERHFARLGFTQVRSTADGSTFWELDLNTHTLADLPISVCCLAAKD